jgi:hypothetical protein
MNGTVDISQFTKAIKTYAEKMQKGMGVVIKDESRLLAERLRQLTRPKTQTQGQNRVKFDFFKTYQTDEWFESKFRFRSEKLQAAVLKDIREQDHVALNALFARSARLSRLKVEAFSESVHRGGRDNRGRVRFKAAVSYPVGAQEQVETYLKTQQKHVGVVKGGWGRCAVLLGGKSPSWINRSTGNVRDASADRTKPSVTLINSTPYGASLMERLNVVPRALAGRAKAIIAGLQKTLQRAKQFSGF